MKTFRYFAPRSLVLPSLVLLVGLLAGACSGAGPSPSPTLIAPAPPPDTGVTSPPGGGGGGAGDGSGGGGGGGGNVPPDIQPQFVVPRPGQLNLQPVAITKLGATVNGRSVKVQADWVSGVEPCYVLDSVVVGREGDVFTIGLFEGSGDLNAVCIEIAAYKATIIDLGDLEPGTYAVRAANGDARPIEVVVQ